MFKKNIIFRADGNSQIGLGHIVRSIALAEMLSNDFECFFWLNNADEKVINIVEQNFNYRNFHFETVNEEVQTLKSELKLSEILILDGQRFDTAYQTEVKPYVHKLVCIDDLATYYFYADMVVNHSNAAIVKQYRTEHYTKVLAGPSYAILRKPFRHAALEKRDKLENIDTLFICMGGSDPFNITNKVLKTALQIKFIKKIFIVIGSAYQFQPELNEIVASNSQGDKHILLEINASAERLIELLKLSQLAICPSSSIALETVSVKCALLTGTVIDNQELLHQALIEKNCAETAGDFNTVSEVELRSCIEKMNDAELLARIVESQSNFIDGISDRRLVKEFKTISL